jgi:hypothetical protein
LNEIDDNLRIVELDIESTQKTSMALDTDALPAFGSRMEVARAIARREPDGDLPPQEIKELMSATSEAQGRLALLVRLLKYAKSDMEDARTP